MLRGAIRFAPTIGELARPLDRLTRAELMLLAERQDAAILDLLVTLSRQAVRLRRMRRATNAGKRRKTPGVRHASR